LRELWKVLPRIPHGNLEAQLNQLSREGWGVRELLPAGSQGGEALVTVVAAKQVEAAR